MAQKKKTPAKAAAAKTAVSRRSPAKPQAKAKKTSSASKLEPRKSATKTPQKRAANGTAKRTAAAAAKKSSVKKPVQAVQAKSVPKKPAPAATPGKAAAAKPRVAPVVTPPLAKALGAAPSPRTVLSATKASAHRPVGLGLKPDLPKAIGAMAHAAATPQAVVSKSILAPKAPAAPAPVHDASAAGPKKPVSQRHGFKTNELVVYPTRGVGRIIGIEEQEIAGMTLELFVIQFEKDKLILRVPTGKLQSVGMRKLAEDGIVRRAMETLKGKARIKRTMWSRRAQEYEAKINSGDLVAIAEVVRDLYRSEAQPEQSYSERQLYEAALDRMAREIAAVDKLDERGASQRITEILEKSARGRRQSDSPAAADEAAKAA